MQALEMGGYDVRVASSLRSFIRDPLDSMAVTDIEQSAELEIERLSVLWRTQGPPLCWFCYHPYYKSPDLIGPTLCRLFEVPYITAEASYSLRRETSAWGDLQNTVLEAVNQAVVNLCFTERDRVGLQQASAAASLVKVSPFIDATPFFAPAAVRKSRHMVVVAMMRSGDKMDSYERLAAALRQLQGVAWTLSVVGHGPLYEEVQECFQDIPAKRIQWHGLLEQSAIAKLLASSSLYVWPGCGEAYGLAYLEAQAAGVPVVAYDIAGVPEVVDHGKTGLLTEALNDELYAQAIASLLNDKRQLASMASNAADHVRNSHSLPGASATLAGIVQRYIIQ